MNLIFDLSHAYYKSYAIFKSRYPEANLSDLDSQQKLTRKFITDFCYSIRLFESTGIQRVICCMDGRQNWRKNVDPEYKGNRTKNEPEFYSVRDECAKYLKDAGFIISHSEMLEADDLIAIWSKFISSNNEECLILSSDKDIRMLVDHNVAVYSNNSKYAEIYYKEPLSWFHKFSSPQTITYQEVSPKWIVFEKTLMGDAGDNVPKILKRGVGYKRCVKLYNDCRSYLSDYKNVYSICKDQDVFDNDLTEELFLRNKQLIDLTNFNGPLNVVKRMHEEAIKKSTEYDFDDEYILNNIYV